MAQRRKQSKAHALLMEYRPTVWRKAMLEAMPETENTALQACIAKIDITQSLADSLLSNKLIGERLYRVIFASYLTVRQPGDVLEILSSIAEKHEPIPRSTYFRLKERAIRMMDAHLEESSGRA